MRKRRAHHSSPPGRTTHGLTLIEVLVVVAIIALLIAILVPSVMKAKWQAKHLMCQTNLKNIAMAWQSYLVESRGDFLKSQKTADNFQVNYGGKSGGQSIYRIPKPLNQQMHLPLVTDDAKMYLCPFDLGNSAIRPTCYDYFGNSYLMNDFLVGPRKIRIAPDDPCHDTIIPTPPHANTTERFASVNVSQVANTDRVLLVGDYGWYDAWSRYCPSSRHSDWHERPMYHNLAFLDGHVRFTRIRKGVYTCGDYTLMPFAQLQQDCVHCQKERTDN